MKLLYTAEIEFEEVQFNGPKNPNWELTEKIAKKVNTIAKNHVTKNLKKLGLKCNDFYCDIFASNDEGEYDCYLSFDIYGNINIENKDQIINDQNYANEIIEKDIIEKINKLKETFIYFSNMDMKIIQYYVEV